jgi:glycosyltransferase involved in cell wall biosynthesis
LTNAKRPLKLIETLSLVREHLKNTTLAIAGMGELSERVGKLVRRNAIKNVVFLGYVPQGDLPALYACSDNYVIASEYEGRPATLL